MSQDSEELRTRVREALLVRIRGAADVLKLSLTGWNEIDLAEALSYGVAAAIDKADTEAWIAVGERGPDYDAHLNLILDALKGT